MSRGILGKGIGGTPLLDSIINEEIKTKKNLQNKKITLAILAIFAISLGAKEGVNAILNKIDKNHQQENIMKDTQDSIENVFVIDTIAVIDTYKETLSEGELEEFEQFSQEKQREQIQGPNK